MLGNEQLQMLRESFKAEVTELLSELESALMDLEERPDDQDLINRAFRALHSIKGSGTMFGFDEMSEFVHEIETVFDRVRKGESSVTRPLINLTLQAKDELGAMLGRSTLDGTPRKDATQRILQEYRSLGSGDLTQVESAAAPIPNSAPPTEHATAEPHGANRFHIRFAPAADLLRRGTDPILLLDEVRELGDCRIVALTDRVPDLDSIVPDECYLAWEIDLITDASLERLESVFEFVSGDAEMEIKAAPMQPGPEDSGLEPPGPAGSDRPEKREPGVAAPGGPGRSAAESPPRGTAGQSAASTVRVPSERLDSLVDLVGELVTVQARLSGQVAHTNDAVIAEIAESIERLTDELRDNAMSLRMVPVHAMFSRLRRLVRDLSVQLGKEVRMETEGQDTELDKTVIERLADPLMHIIRNSVDHGIENPDERRTTGKDGTGVIRLRATHQGASVVVSVTDDGRGLDVRRIREVAEQRGLIGKDTDLSDAEIRNLIFAPGFSTTSEVTDVSGRGVGMDVVRKTIESLGGSIETRSEPGRGTTVALRLPLTLAIIDGLLVGVGGQRYVLPLSMVHELLEFDRSRHGHAGNRRIMEARDTLLPYIDLNEHFQTMTTPPTISQAVVVQWETSQLALVVDAVEGQQQTVIKSLGALPQRVDAVSGATILGDGSVALIIDVPKLVADATRSRRQLQQEAV